MSLSCNSSGFGQNIKFINYTIYVTFIIITTNHCVKQTEEIAFENGQISNFEGLLTLTLDWVIQHTVVHHSSTSIYMPNFTEIKEIFCGWMDGRTHTRTDI